MHPLISSRRPEIATICRRYRIRRLEVFGSAARGADFAEGASDADFLVEFAPESPATLNSFFGAKADLEQLLGLEVDLVEAGAVRNPYVNASINESRVSVYG